MSHIYQNTILQKIRYGILHHIKILTNWAFINRHSISFKEILCYISWIFKANKEMNSAIVSINEQDEFDRIIHFKNVKDPLFYSKKYNLNTLGQVIREMFGTIDWHRYEKMGTFIKPDDIVVDCGSAEGLFTLIIKDRCKHVYAIEPMTTYVNSLKRSFQSSPNVTIIQEGLSDKTETLYIHDDSIASYINNDPNNGVPVFVNTIDNIFYEKNIPVNFIKADIEGFEIQMLKGAKKTIQQNKPRIAVTTYHNQSDFDLIKDFLDGLDLGYIIHKKGIQYSGAPVMLHAYVPNK